MRSKWLGVEVTKRPKLSDRVCKPCGRKIRNASELCSFIQQGINTLAVVEVTTVKRQLPSTVSSPERSPAVKKVLKVTELDVPSGRKSTAKKSLFGKENVESDSASTSGRQVGTTIDPLLSALNVDSLLEKKKTTQRTNHSMI